MSHWSVDEARKLEAACFIPVVKRQPAILVEGRGSRVRDAEGREYLDLMAGWAVCCLGHGHPGLVGAISEQAGRLMQTTNVFYNEPQLELMRRLAALTQGAVPHSFLVSSGTEAIEGALKIAHRATGRTKFVSTQNSFHGRTLGALRLNGNPKHRDPYRALLPDATLVPFDDLDAARRAVDDSTAAFFVEPIQGEGGVNVPRAGYLAGLREICAARGALLIADEVQTGVARTGTMLAVQREGVVPDVIALGKGLGGGFPVGAFLVTDAVSKTVQLGDHGTTYGGNPLACAAANTVLRIVSEEKLAERAAELGSRLLERLQAFVRDHPGIAVGARGRGLLCGLVLRDAARAARLPLAALERGVLVNVTAGCVLRLFPALNIPEDELWSGLETVLDLVASPDR